MRFRSKRSYNRGATALAGGIVLGALGSRLLPPVVSMVSGSVRAQLGGDPFKILRQDHQKILSLLDTMQQLPDDSTARSFWTGPIFRGDGRFSMYTPAASHSSRTSRLKIWRGKHRDSLAPIWRIWSMNRQFWRPGAARRRLAAPN